MIHEILRLESVIPNGLGGYEAGFINLIYSNLLQDSALNMYKFILINQIDEELIEGIHKDGKKVYINIRYTGLKTSGLKNADVENQMRIDCIHQALVRLANLERKLDIVKLQAIKAKILKQNFVFQFICKTFICVKDKTISAKLIVYPQMHKFDYYVSIEDKGIEKCRLKIYTGLTGLYYFDAILSSGKWQHINKLIISGKRKEAEIIVAVDKCEVTFRNLTKYDNPPYFEMMKAEKSAIDREKAYQDWLHSLPPSQRAFLSYAPS